MLKSIKELQSGDTYSYNNELYTVVESAISNFNGALTIFVTRPWFYIYPNDPYVYGYTNAEYGCFVENIMVDVVYNLLEIGKEKRDELFELKNKREYDIDSIEKEMTEGEMAEYHVGCGAFGIYAGTLNSKNKNLWQNKSEVFAGTDVEILVCVK